MLQRHRRPSGRGPHSTAPGMPPTNVQDTRSFIPGHPRSDVQYAATVAYLSVPIKLCAMRLGSSINAMNLGNPLKLIEWGLKNYLGGISKTTKDVGKVVRDYRNYIHRKRITSPLHQHLAG